MASYGVTVLQKDNNNLVTLYRYLQKEEGKWSNKSSKTDQNLINVENYGSDEWPLNTKESEKERGDH